MILVITSERITGLGYHRQVIPFKNLASDFTIEFQTSEEGLTDEYLKGFKCISLLREGKYIDRYKKLGLIVHFDIDDYWVLPSGHNEAKKYKENNHEKKTEECLKKVDFVTTTTRILAEKIKKFNKNVYVLPNAIDTKDEQWHYNHFKASHDRMRFGYIAGAHHVQDVEMIHPEILKLYRDATIKDKWQLLTAGFNWIKMTENDIRPNAYYKWVEQTFTNNYSFLKDAYTHALNTKIPLEFKDMNEPYQRLNGLDVFNYGRLYDSIDVALAPLIKTTFNSCKSQLKMIEAGFKRKACIVSDVLPYSLDATEENCLTAQPNEWRDKIKYLVNNPNKVFDLQEGLYEYVNKHYHIDVVNVERKQIFEQWLCK